jgi:hypothetical protein
MMMMEKQCGKDPIGSCLDCEGRMGMSVSGLAALHQAKSPFFRDQTTLKMEEAGGGWAMEGKGRIEWPSLPLPLLPQTTWFPFQFSTFMPPLIMVRKLGNLRISNHLFLEFLKLLIISSLLGGQQTILGIVKVGLFPIGQFASFFILDIFIGNCCCCLWCCCAMFDILTCGVQIRIFRCHPEALMMPNITQGMAHHGMTILGRER